MSISDPDAFFLRSISSVAYANPFSPARVAAEKAALDSRFIEGDPIWSVSVADPEAVNPNIARMTARLEPILENIRAGLASGVSMSAAEWIRYEECVHYLLYERYHRAFVETAGQWGFFRSFRSDWEHFFLLPGKHFQPAISVEHFFACCWQLMRAFYRIFENIIGSSMPAARLRAAIWESIFTCDLRRYRKVLWRKMGDFPTLITGPSGTGKELVAKAIAGARYIPFDPAKLSFSSGKGKEFFAVNLAALSPALIESELFGHKRGSFTGAVADRVGWLESCPPRGSVFLDELGEMEHSIQVKLLRVIESREYSPVGDTIVKRFEGKLIAATNRDLAVEIQSGRFREDLYYRLCADLIRTPSLAEQVEDKPESFHELLYYMTRRAVGEDAGEAYPLVREWVTKNIPKAYRWPGNYRELEQCVRNVLIRQSYRPLTPPEEHRPFWKEFEEGSLTADQVLNYYVTLVYNQSGNYVEAARRLGLDRRTVKSRVEDNA